MTYQEIEAEGVEDFRATKMRANEYVLNLKSNRAMEELKTCSRCGRELPLVNYRKTRWGGYANVCTECTRQSNIETRARKKEVLAASHQAELEKASAMRLQDFTPRQLMEELKRRGYEGTLTYVEKHIIDLRTI